MRIVWIVLAVLGVLALVGVVGYWFATGGSPGREPAKWLTARPIAHRGQWAEGSERPENSLGAFDEAARNGYSVELDVQLTSDGHVIVFHDDNLERMTGEKGAPGEHTLEQLQALQLLGGSQTIPTLEEVFELVDGRVPIFIEIKNPGDVGALEEKTARETAAYAGDAAIMSFNPFSLARVAKIAPEVARGQLSSAFEDEDLESYKVFVLRYLLMNWTSRPDFIGYDLRELPNTTTKLQQWRGRPLMGWTAESEERLAAAEKICDVVESDPAALSARPVP